MKYSSKQLNTRVVDIFQPLISLELVHGYCLDTAFTAVSKLVYIVCIVLELCTLWLKSHIFIQFLISLLPCKAFPSARYFHVISLTPESHYYCYCPPSTTLTVGVCPSEKKVLSATIFHRSFPNFYSMFYSITQKFYNMQFHKNVAKIVAVATVFLFDL